MLLAISTSESKNASPFVAPALKNACTIVCIVAMVSANCIAIDTAKILPADTGIPFTTDIVSKPEYYRGNISIIWDGVSSMTMGLSDSIRRIREIQQLPDNWNDNGAQIFESSIIELSCKFVRSLTIQPSIFPTARNSIQFEYENKTGDYLEFELFAEGRLKMFSYNHDGTSKTIDTTIENAEKVVNEFYGRKL